MREKYQFEAIYFIESTETTISDTIEVEAKSRIGAWTKALYEASRKDTDEVVLIELDLI